MSLLLVIHDRVTEKLTDITCRQQAKFFISPEATRNSHLVVCCVVKVTQYNFKTYFLQTSCKTLLEFKHIFNIEKIKNFKWFTIIFNFLSWEKFSKNDPETSKRDLNLHNLRFQYLWNTSSISINWNCKSTTSWLYDTNCTALFTAK